MEIGARPTAGFDDRTLRRQVSIQGGDLLGDYLVSLTCIFFILWPQRSLYLPLVWWLFTCHLSRFFNSAMDQLRSEYNKEDQRVVFVATSDDFHWIKKHLVQKQNKDIFFPYELLSASRAPLPNNRFIKHFLILIKDINLISVLYIFVL